MKNIDIFKKSQELNKEEFDSLSLEEYKQLVDDAAEEKSNFMINNGTFLHAQVLFKKIIENANDSISLVSQECTRKFFNKKEVYETFLDFIERTKGKGKIIIIVEKENNEGELKKNPFVLMLLEHYSRFNRPDSFEVYKLIDPNKIKIKHTNRLFHFLLVDKEGPYRFQVCKDMEKCECEEDDYADAVANFGNKKGSKILSNIFEEQLNNNTVKVSLN